MKRLKKTFLPTLVIFLALPLLAAAQAGVDLNDGAVPIPYIGSGARGPAAEGTFTTLALSIINILLAVVGIISVLFIIIGGLRYVTASGNEEAATAAKQTILHAVIGIALVIMSFAIVYVISVALLYGAT